MSDEGSSGCDDSLAFLYKKPGQRIPRHVTHIRVCPSIKVIYRNTFHQLAKLVEVELPDGLESIDEHAFSGCKLLKSIVVPSTVKVIGRRAFYNCRGIEHVELPDGLERIEDGAFGSCVSLKQVTFPAKGKLSEGVKHIGTRAFAHCISLTCIDIPSTVKVICDRAFIGCKNLEEVHLCNEAGQLEEIKHSAFEGCESLKQIEIPSSVNTVYCKAFLNCKQLKVVELHEGLGHIDGHSFWNCKSLQCIRLPASIKIIGDGAFLGCEKLEEIMIGNGIEQVIRPGAFEGCKSLKSIRVPSGVNTISGKAFLGCKQLEEVELCEGLEVIGGQAFKGCWSLNRIKVPSTVRELNVSAFRGCHQLISLEHLNPDGEDDFDLCPSIRNVAVSTKAQPSKLEGRFIGCHDLRRLFSSSEDIHNALKSRFDGLPIHELCYFQAFHLETLEHIENIIGHMSVQNKASLNNQDCLGMTPLHILTCSTKQSIDIYKLIIANHPKSLIAEDKWGCLPLLYAVWGNVPAGIVQLLVENQKSSFPNHTLNWEKMIDTLCRAGTCFGIIQRLINIQQTSYPSYSLDWQTVSRELTVCCIVRCESIGDFPLVWEAMIETFEETRVHQELVQVLLDLEQNFISEKSCADLLGVASDDFIRPVIGSRRPEFHVHLDMFRFLVKCNVQERVKAIRVGKWQLDIVTMVKANQDRPYAGGSQRPGVFPSRLDIIHSRLVFHERAFHQLTEATCFLELALWKAKINEYDEMTRHREAWALAVEKKGQLRINCGADIIIPNVLSFLVG